MINGTQLYFDEEEQQITDKYNEAYSIIYTPREEAEEDVKKTKTYTYIDSTGESKSEDITFVTDINSAKKEYQPTINNINRYSARFKNSNLNVVVNFTLDNRIYVYGTARRSYRLRNNRCNT